MKISLSSPFSFNVFPHHEKLRLVVLKNEDEYVCRIENKKKLNLFLENENSSIFKGRLQLIKNQDDIFVQVKGEIIGRISMNNFKECIVS